MKQDPSLPPGVTDNMLPGNRPEDREYDAEIDTLFDFLTQQIADHAPDIGELTKHVEQFFSDLSKRRRQSLKSEELPFKDSSSSCCADCGKEYRHGQTCPQFRKFLGEDQ